MTVFTVTVADEQAEHIKKMLTDAHVISIEEKENRQPESALDRIKRILDEAKGKNLFKDIEDPSKWQGEIRKEWDRDF